MSEIPATPDTRVCPQCGAMNPEDANYCQNCGSVMSAGVPDPQSELSSATTAISVEDLRKMREAQGASTEQWTAGAGHTVAYKTDIGKKHHVNQDAGNAWTWAREDGSAASLLAVADGVSAGRHSEAASRLAIEIVYDQLSPVLQDPAQDADAVLSALVSAVKEANHQVAARPHVAIANADATTIVTVFSIGSEAGGAWVGDSRAYLLSGGSLSRLTLDHSWAEGVVSRGLMSVEQASRDPRAHMIMRWLGPPDQDDPGVDAFRRQLQPGDIMFCCTDGLYGYFAPPVAEEDEMAHVFVNHGRDLSGALEDLVETALGRGGHDNITISALRLDRSSDLTEEPATQELPAITRESADQTLQFRVTPGQTGRGRTVGPTR